MITSARLSEPAWAMRYHFNLFKSYSAYFKDFEIFFFNGLAADLVPTGKQIYRKALTAYR